MRSKNRVLTVLSAAIVSMAIVASSAAAAEGVVIGSVNPVTGQTTLLTDKLKKQFTDGGAIEHLYLLARPEGAGYALVRAGRAADGSCHTELIATDVSGTDVRLGGPQLEIMFTCEDVDGRCAATGVLLHGMCLPAATFAGCKCLSDAPPAAGEAVPKCRKEYTSILVDLSDVVYHPFPG
jgi:hypothetical protein